MKSKCNVILRVIENRFTGEKTISMKALIRVKNPAFQGSSYGTMEITPKHQIKYSTAQYLALQVGKSNDLEAKNPSLLLENLNAEYIKGKRTDGTEYYAVLVNLSKNSSDEMIRIFYLDGMQAKSMQDFKSEYEFIEGQPREDDSLDTIEEEDDEANE